MESNEQRPPGNIATTAVLAALAGVRDAVTKVWETLERREQQSPGRFVITENDVSIYAASSTRLRLVTWVLAVDNAGTYQLRAGQKVVGTVVAAGADTFVIPLEVTLDSGLDLSTEAVGAGGAVVSSYVIAFTE